MDDRISAHAKTIVDWSARIEAGDDVVVAVGEGAHDLAVAVASVLGERGANVVTTYDSEELQRAYLRGGDQEFEPEPAFEQALYENADAVLSLGGSRNAAAMADVPEQRRNDYRRSRRGIREARLATDWVSTVHPTRADAQRAGMAFEQYRSFVYDAVLRDWESLAEEMAQLKTLLDEGDRVRISGGKPGEYNGTKTVAVTSDTTMCILERGDGPAPTGEARSSFGCHGNSVAD